MIDICKITTPVHGSTDVEVNELINQLQQRLRQAKDDNKHFGWKCVRFSITQNENGELWMTGFTKKDLQDS